jgi:hypothetical protein
MNQQRGRSSRYGRTDDGGQDPRDAELGHDGRLEDPEGADDDEDGDGGPGDERTIGPTRAGGGRPSQTAEARDDDRGVPICG